MLMHNLFNPLKHSEKAKLFKKSIIIKVLNLDTFNFTYQWNYASDETNLLNSILFLFSKFLHAEEMISYHPFLENSKNLDIKWNTLSSKYVKKDRNIASRLHKVK